jgi:hypothetical protein
VKSVLDAIASIPPDVSETISKQLDALPLGTKGPHRIVDTVVKALADFVKTAGEVPAKALDKPWEAVKK